MSQRRKIALGITLPVFLLAGGAALLSLRQLDEASKQIYLESARAALRQGAPGMGNALHANDRQALEARLATLRAAHPQFRLLGVARNGEIVAHTVEGA